MVRGTAATMGFQNICDVMFLPCDRFSRVCWTQRATRRRSKSWRRSNRNGRKRANPEMRVTIIHSNQKLHVLAVKSCHWSWIRRERTVCALVWMLSGQNFQPAKMARYFFYWSNTVSSDNKIENKVSREIITYSFLCCNIDYKINKYLLTWKEN